MKTIRRGVFETNSSSTHSITIQTIGIPQNQEVRPLVIDNILYPDHLDDYSTYISYGDGGWELTCNTKDMKAALVAHWVRCVCIEENNSEKDFFSLMGFMKEQLGYSDIIFESEFNWTSNYYPYEECGPCLSDDLHELPYLIDVILDDTQEIIESNIPH